MVLKTAKKNGIWQQKLPKYKAAAKGKRIDSNGFQRNKPESDLAKYRQIKKM